MTSLPPFAPENLGEALTNALAHKLRPAALSMMRDTCRIDRPTGRTKPDPVTLELVEEFDPVVAEADGMCRVKPAEMQAQERTVGELEFSTSRHIVWRPIDATVYREGDRITITAVDPVVGDPAMVGRVLWIVGDPMRSQGTKRELACTEVRPHG